MSAAARSTRARRGRVMIIGEIPELTRLVQHLQGTSSKPVLARNLFDALGEISIAQAGAPITTVLLSDRCFQAATNRSVEAMRRLDPSIRVIMILQPHSSPLPDWLAQSVDECIRSPINSADLKVIFDQTTLDSGETVDDLAMLLESAEPITKPATEPRAGSARTVSQTPHMQQAAIHDLPDDMPAQASPSKTASPTTASESPRHALAATELAAQRQIEWMSAAPMPTPEPEPVQVHVATEQLGDTDLVEAIMTSSQSVRPLALRLIAQQTQWTDVQLIANSDQPSAISVQPLAPGSAGGIAASASSQLPNSVPVAFNNQTFGNLASTLASVEQLQPWADWLARWLALDKTFHDHRCKALQDDLTCAGNRRFFNSFLQESIIRAAKERRAVTLMVFDIDNFKTYNDQFGHDAGDEILRETVKLMNSVIRQGDRVCRIGGDEFAVIFADPEAPREAGSKHLESIESIATRFQDQICNMRFPKLGADAPGTLSISAGLATYPWDGIDVASLLRHADQLALESKRKGKNAITFGPGAKAACRPEA